MNMSNETPDELLTSKQHLARIIEASAAGIDDKDLFALISQQFEIEVSEGNFTPERQALFQTMLPRIERCMETQPGDLADSVNDLAKLKAMMPAVAEACQTPSRRQSDPVVQKGTYQEVLMAKFKRVSSWLGQQAVALNRGEFTNESLKELYILRCGEIENAILSAPDSVAARGIERELVRRFALEVKETALAEHLMIADPIWPTPVVTGNYSGVFFSGFEHTQESLLRALNTLDVGLSVMPQKTQGNPAEYRWNQMRVAAVCVFDMTHYNRNETDKKHRQNQASIGYELGIALALGRPIVVLANPSTVLPFDIDLSPVILEKGADPTNLLATAIDDAIYTVQRTGGENSLKSTREQARLIFSMHPDADVRLTAKHALGSGQPDASHLRNTLDTIVDMVGVDAPFLLTPAWAGSYPSKRYRRCFHITPFGPAWANTVRDIVESACNNASEKTKYRRGDTVMTADIIRSIWDEICRATHVVVDLTGLNFNALMELGMAHTLGREVLLITQDTNFDTYPKSLKKQRFHQYSLTQQGVSELKTTLERFFTGEAEIDVSPPQINKRQSTTALTCPEALSIRAHIDNTLQQSHGNDSKALRSHAKLMKVKMYAERIEDVRSYIDCVPAFVEGLAEAAKQSNLLAEVQPVLTTMQSYFSETNDFIPDHNGLLGLLDDAYIVYVFIEELNNDFIMNQGRPLLAIDAAAMSQDIEPLLGEHIRTTIRQQVRANIEQNKMTRNLKTAGKWLLGGMAAAVAWKVIANNRAESARTDEKWDLMIRNIYQ